jgi:hypothetical protein
MLRFSADPHDLQIRAADAVVVASQEVVVAP